MFNGNSSRHLLDVKRFPAGRPLLKDFFYGNSFWQLPHNTCREFAGFCSRVDYQGFLIMGFHNYAYQMFGMFLTQGCWSEVLFMVSVNATDQTVGRFLRYGRWSRIWGNRNSSWHLLDVGRFSRKGRCSEFLAQGISSWHLSDHWEVQMLGSSIKVLVHWSNHDIRRLVGSCDIVVDQGFGLMGFHHDTYQVCGKFLEVNRRFRFVGYHHDTYQAVGRFLWQDRWSGVLGRP